MEGSLEYDLSKHAGAGADKEPGNALKSDGWEKVRGPPGGYQRSGEFEKLALTASLTCMCTCPETGANTLKKLKWEVSYDRSGTGGPN